MDRNDTTKHEFAWIVLVLLDCLYCSTSQEIFRGLETVQASDRTGHIPDKTDKVFFTAKEEDNG